MPETKKLMLCKLSQWIIQTRLTLLIWLNEKVQKLCLKIIRAAR